MEKTIAVASTNQGKLREFKAMLEPRGYRVLSLADLPEAVEPEETGTSFQENAVIKAQSVTDRFGIEAIADDSGICIAALNEEPGIHSARWMGHETSYDIKNQKIIELVQDAEDRTCHYACAIAWCAPGKEPKVFFDTWYGEVAKEPRGSNGFGYDPIFYLPELGITSAEMTSEEKNRRSHRGKALRKLENWLNEGE
ncbi:MAG: RdgB/HAM1 family non-canonical purine NTP pyrophosphatase [Solobacterium sp.]|nr:RdgB/HAM1 family non-canonical purine NTP pyrophosphatase [Solobacterium sp.]